MNSSRKIYILAAAFLSLGGIWLALNAAHFVREDHTLCIFKNITSLPCPSCGSTRAWMLLLNGDVAHALLLNPLGILTGLAAMICGGIILSDLVLEKNNFILVYQRINTLLKKKSVYIPMVSLVVMNWGWNIAKGL